MTGKTSAKGPCQRKSLQWIQARNADRQRASLARVGPDSSSVLHYLSESETESVSHSLVSHSLRTHGLYTAKLFCPWNSPGKKTGVGRHSLLFTIWATREILEIAPIHVLWICNTIWPSQPLPLIFPLPSIFPNIRVFSNVLTLLTRWPKYWSFSFILSPSNEYWKGWFPLG